MNAAVVRYGQDGLQVKVQSLQAKWASEGRLADWKARLAEAEAKLVQAEAEGRLTDQGYVDAKLAAQKAEDAWREGIVKTTLAGNAVAMIKKQVQTLELELATIGG